MKTKCVYIRKAMAPKKSVFTLTEIVLLSILWSSASFVWQGVIKQGLTFAFGKLGLTKYPTDILVAVTLLAIVFAMVLLFKNVDIGRSSVFQLVDVSPTKPSDVPRIPPPARVPEDGYIEKPKREEFMPMESMPLVM